ncbi:hypothetical protein ACH32B_22940 [Enterobacter dykesii]
MRYLLLVILLNGLFYLIVKHAAPEWHGTHGYYAGLIICTLIAAIITWRDPPGWLDKILLGVMKYGVLSAGIIFFSWGVGYKLAFWGQGNSETVFVSAGDVILPNLALVTGVVIAGWGYMRYFRR